MKNKTNQEMKACGMCCCLCLEDMENDQPITNTCGNHYVHTQCYVRYILFEYMKKKSERAYLVILCPMCRDQILYGNILETIGSFRKHIKSYRQHLQLELYKQKVDMTIIRCRELFHRIKSDDKFNRFIYKKMREHQTENFRQLNVHYKEIHKTYKETDKLWNILNPVLFKFR
jgi:hypothetical protein